MIDPPDAEISLGYSSCPNDTFIFWALSSGRIPTGPWRVRTIIEDVESLNRRAEREELDVTKLSFPAFARVRDRYRLLGAGAALGRGCGPLVVAKEAMEPRRLRQAGIRVAIPGERTTAALLLRLFAPCSAELVPMTFDRIFDAVLDRRVDAGVIIHEGRFTYEARGLIKVIDLGEWWAAETGLPIPLGGIAARKALGPERIDEIEGWVRSSVLAAHESPAAAAAYVRLHAREMDPAVVRAHIQLYVNRFTVDLGEEGRRAIETLLRMAEERGALPAGG